MTRYPSQQGSLRYWPLHSIGALLDATAPAGLACAALVQLDLSALHRALLTPPCIRASMARTGMCGSGWWLTSVHKSGAGILALPTVCHRAWRTTSCAVTLELVSVAFAQQESTGVPWVAAPRASPHLGLVAPLAELWLQEHPVLRGSTGLETSGTYKQGLLLR